MIKMKEGINMKDFKDILIGSCLIEIILIGLWLITLL